MQITPVNFNQNQRSHNQSNVSFGLKATYSAKRAIRLIIKEARKDKFDTNIAAKTSDIFEDISNLLNDKLTDDILLGTDGDVFTLAKANLPDYLLVTDSPTDYCSSFVYTDLAKALEDPKILRQKLAENISILKKIEAKEAQETQQTAEKEAMDKARIKQNTAQVYLNLNSTGFIGFVRRMFGLS